MNSVPKDVLLEIFKNLHFNDLKNISPVCKRWSELNYSSLWRLECKDWIRREFYNSGEMIIPKLNNFHEFEGFLTLMLHMAAGSPTISWGDDYANDIVVNCAYIFWDSIGKSYTNLKQLHYIDPKTLVKVTGIMYKLYSNYQLPETTSQEIINRFNEGSRYKQNPFGGYYYAWGDVIRT
jgi:F-box-like